MIKEKFDNLLNKLGHSEGSFGRKVINSGIWVSLSSVLLNIVAVLRSVVLARLLSPEVFGLMSICYIVIKGVEVVTQTGFGAALIHKQENFEESKDVAFTLMVLRGFILALIVFLISPLIAHFYDEPILDAMIQVIAVSFIFNGFLNINQIAHQKELNFRRLVYLEQLVALLNTILVIAIAYYYRNVWALVVGHVVSMFVQMVMSYVVIPGRPKFKFEKKIALELFHYGKYITGVSILLFVATEIDQAIIGKLLDVEALGYYYLAFMLANLPTTHVSKIVSKIVFPAFSKLQNDKDALSDAYIRIVGLVGNIAIPAAAGIMVLAPEIIMIVYGEKWAGAIVPLQILCVFGGARAIAAINGNMFNAIGKPGIDFYIAAARLVFILSMIFPMIIYFGLDGAAVAVTVPMILHFALGMMSLKKNIDLDLIKSFKVLSQCLLYSVVMVISIAAVKYLIQPVGITKLIVLIVFGGIVYLALNRKTILSFVKGDKLI